MTRETLERKEDQLLDEIINLGQMVISATIKSVDLLANKDIEGSKVLFAEDKLINDLRFKIERDTLIAIATQQPLATDLRILASILEISTELERMGDYAKGIAKINIDMGEDPLLKPLIDLPKMAELATQMLDKALRAFIDRDENAARQIFKEDDKVDDLYNKIHRELINFMIEDRDTIDPANQLLWAAHNLERLADRVVNICERTIFVNTGEMVELADSG